MKRKLKPWQEAELGYLLRTRNLVSLTPNYEHRFLQLMAKRTGWTRQTVATKMANYGLK